MEEAVILKTEFNNVEDHTFQWENLCSKNSGLIKILEVIEKPQGTAIIFSHDDPDGITSGLIFKRVLQKKGWQVSCHFPEGFLLQPDQFQKIIDTTPGVSNIFLLDKGTLASYDDFAAKLPVYIVDHHPTPVVPTKCIYFNPSLPIYTFCSTSILAHGIATLAGTRDQFDDFLCLVGLKGDWAIEPVTGVLADFARPFFIKYGQKFKNLFRLVKERPTQFDAEQRNYTCLLSRITEFIHATCGGGFSYFYHDRDISLKDLNHAHCIAEALEGTADKIDKIAAITSLDDFVDLIAEPHRTSLKKIFTFFLQDWESANRILDSSVKALQLGDTTIYLFVGPKVPLLPMIGSIKLFELKQKAGDKLAQIIMVSSVSNDYTHVSVRGTGDRVHSGKICSELQDSMQRIYAPFKDKISGGGHPKAAECTVRTAEIPFINVLAKVIELLGEMKALDIEAARGTLNEEKMARAEKLGLEYLKH